MKLFSCMCCFLFQNKSNTPSESNLAELCGGSGDQAEWHAGQDDSALHGRHLPPSPRKRVSAGGLTDALFILREESGGKALGADDLSGPPAVRQPASPSASRVQLGSPEVSQTQRGKTETNETLSQVSEDLLTPGLGRHPSTSVPWEKEGKEAEDAPKGVTLPHEVVSLCHVTSALEQDLNISEENTSGNQA